MLCLPQKCHLSMEPTSIEVGGAILNVKDAFPFYSHTKGPALARAGSNLHDDNLLSLELIPEDIVKKIPLGNYWAEQRYSNTEKAFQGAKCLEKIDLDFINTVLSDPKHIAAFGQRRGLPLTEKWLEWFLTNGADETNFSTIVKIAKAKEGKG